MSEISRISGSPKPAPVDPDVKKVAQRFEAIFVRQMLGTMRQAKLAEDVFGSSATDNFREMADARTAEDVATLGQFGIAQLIERQLARSGAPRD